LAILTQIMYSCIVVPYLLLGVFAKKISSLENINFMPNLHELLVINNEFRMYVRDISILLTTSNVNTIFVNNVFLKQCNKS
jgi:hypothetical protein